MTVNYEEKKKSHGYRAGGLEGTDNKIEGCYFYVVNINVINRNYHSNWYYPDLSYARRPVAHDDDAHIPTFHQL